MTTVNETVIELSMLLLGWDEQETNKSRQLKHNNKNEDDLSCSERTVM